MEAQNLILIICLFSSGIKSGQGQLDQLAGWDRDKFKEEASQTFNLVLHKYNPRVRPPRPFIDIKVVTTLKHIRHLDLKKQELQTVLDIETTWYDSRLEWYPDKVFQIMVNTSIVWTPDIVFTNVVAPTRALYPNVLMISHKGNVQWTQKEEITTYCQTRTNDIFQNCTLTLGFMSDIRGDQTDRFFTDTSEFIVPETFYNHEWNILSTDVDLVSRNDTGGRISYINIYLELERRESEGARESLADERRDEGHHQLTTSYAAQHQEKHPAPGGKESGSATVRLSVWLLCACSGLGIVARVLTLLAVR